LVVAQVASSGVVSGTLRDNTGAPVANADVTLSGPQKYVTRSDAHGAFSIAGVAPGLYRLDADHAGYNPASATGLVVISGQTLGVTVVMGQATFSSLQTIATVRTTTRSAFNTGTASVNVISGQAFQDQAEPQVTRVLNQTPGVQISLPSSSGNGAVPGAITFPNIRGALSYETASLIDGHPLSVGEYGDYVTTFLNSFLLGGVEIVKGPGATAPETNYAIGGTVNFLTKDPTLNPTPDYTFGVDNRGGTFSNFGFSDTVGKLGFVVDIATIDEPSAVNGSNQYFYPLNSGGICQGGTCYSLYSSYSADRATYVPGTASKIYNNYPLVACCYPVSGQYDSVGELFKLRYKFSDATVATVSYLNGSTEADQNGNTSSLIPSLFTPNGGYTSTSFPTNSQFLMNSSFVGAPEIEANNEPIFQAEVRTTLHNDTILARYYNAGIKRIIQTPTGVDQPYTINAQLWGTVCLAAASSCPAANVQQYTGQTVPLEFWNSYTQSEVDNLAGYSLEWTHPIGLNNTLSASWDNTNSQTTTGTLESDDAYSEGAINPHEPYWTSLIPHGSGQIFNTYLLRDRAQIGEKLNVVASVYENTYKSTYALASPAPLSNGAGYTYPAGPYDAGWKFQTHQTQHTDERVGLTYRLNPNAIVRFSAGSAIAPPYIYLLSTLQGTISQVAGSTNYLQTVNAGTLQPETAFGYDLGGDVRLRDGVTTISGDLYLTNLFNAFITQVYDSGIVCDTSYSASCTNPGELYFKSNVNLNNERYEGIELQIRRSPQTGLGYNLAGGLQRGYAYNLPACFYSTTVNNCAAYNTNLGIIAGANDSGNALSSTAGVLNGFSNQAIPYLNGNAEISYRFGNGAYASFGGTVYGKNNSLFEQPFTIAYLTARYPLNENVSLQISGDNIFNTLSGLFPIQGGGVPISLAGVPAGSPAGTPAVGASYGNVLGPATWRFVITKTFGAGARDNGHARNSSR
jgi:hypothetical protein